MTTVTIYHLEMNSPDALVRCDRSFADTRVEKLGTALPSLNRFFYREVGRSWQWTDKLTWDDDGWNSYVCRPVLHTYVGYKNGTPFGYFELESQLDGADVEIKIFGLLPTFIGQGLGGYLLTEAVIEAWKLEPRRVWVHTCTLDHPNAKANYERRGFVEFKREVGR